MRHCGLSQLPETVSTSPRSSTSRETLELLLAFASPIQRFMLACRQGDEAAARAALRDHPALMDRLTADDRRAITRRGLERREPRRSP